MPPTASTEFLRKVSEFGGTRGVIALAVVACIVECRRGQPRAVVAVPHPGRRRSVRAVERDQVPRRTGASGLQPADRFRRNVVPVRSFHRRRGDARGDRSARHPPAITTRQDPRCRARRRRCGDGRRDAGLPRRALVHRRRRRPAPRLGVVRDVLDRLRRPVAHLRSAGRRGGSGRRRRTSRGIKAKVARHPLGRSSGLSGVAR